MPAPIGFYNISKTTLIAMMKVLSRELHSDKIRVNCIAPGLIKTDFSRDLWANDEKKTIKCLDEIYFEEIPPLHIN